MEEQITQHFPFDGQQQDSEAFQMQINQFLVITDRGLFLYRSQRTGTKIRIL